jgi:protease-4
MRRAFALAALALATAACDGRPKSSAPSTSSREHEPKSGPSVAVLDLTDGLPEIEAAGFLGVPVHTASFDRFVRGFPALAKDKDVKGLFVRFGSTSFGMARAIEVGEHLAAQRDAGMPVFCHADVFTNATMMAAARGCSRVWISPAGTVEATGIGLELLYFHKLLADELHLSVDFLQIGKYKGAEEPFTRDGPSDEARQTMQSMMGSLRDAWLDAVKRGRGRDDAVQAIEDGPWGPEAAKEHGLVDDIGFVDEALDAVKKQSGAVRDEVRFGRGAEEKGDDLGDVVRLLAGAGRSAAPVALIRATGAIAMAPGGGVLGERSGITETEMAKVLARVEHDDAIKALVLRIDSPGGSALASDLIWHHLRKIRAKKPIVVSVGGMAASGGYYISSAANAIVAEPTSIVGSIGVVSGKVAAGDALAKVGVHTETIPGNAADPKARARVAYGSILTPWDDATKQRLVDSAKSIYDLFLARIEEGRGMTLEKITPYAEGRLFSGAQAKANGLVDEIGGLDFAIAKARALAKLPDDAGVAALSPRSGLLEALAGGDGNDESRAPAPGVEGLVPGLAPGGSPLDVVERVAPDLVPFVASLDAMTTGERSLVAVPYAMVLR